MEYLNEFAKYLQNRKSPLTTENYLSTVARYVQYLKGKPPDKKNADAFINYLRVKGNVNKSLNRHLSAIRMFFKHVLNEELKIDGFLVQKIMPVWLSYKEQVKVISVCETQYEKAVVVFFLKTGLRIGEACLLKITDISDDGIITVTGKGAKQRLVPISDAVLKVITDYVSTRIEISDYIFVGGQKKMELAIHAVCRRAGITKNITAHKLRHSFASKFASDTKDVVALRDLLGHTNIATTNIYMHTDIDALKKVMPESMKRV